MKYFFISFNTMTEYVLLVLADKDNNPIWKHPFERYRAEEIIKLIDEARNHPFFKCDKSEVGMYDGEYFRVLGMTNDYSKWGVMMYQQLRLFKSPDIDKRFHHKYAECLHRTLMNDKNRMVIIDVPKKIRTCAATPETL